MTLPKEGKRETPVTGPQQAGPPSGQTGASQRSAPRSGWQMPGGEDLLNFALSAGLVAGSWWLEMQRAREQAGPEDPAAAPAAEGGTR